MRGYDKNKLNNDTSSFRVYDSRIRGNYYV